MAVYTVHFPPAAPGARPAPEKIVILRDDFSWPAFLFGPLWLIWRGAWLAALLWTLLLAAVSFAAWKLQAPKYMTPYIGMAFGAWLGFEGSRLIAWTLNRRGYVEGDIVIGDNEEEAEIAFFHRWRSSATPEILPPEPTE
ncbi:MAG: DUF2628 domain-containing protein [Methylocystis sp.]|nr:DUF2628 domain-containing protein [Methylocystis sp.]